MVAAALGRMGRGYNVYCASDDGRRNWCPVDTRGGVKSGASTQRFSVHLRLYLGERQEGRLGRPRMPGGL